MSVTGAITEKGTIWVREFDKQGRLSRKKVIHGHMQYDTLFKAGTGELRNVIATDPVKNKCVLHIAQQKLTWWNRLFFTKKLLERATAKGATIVEADGQSFLKFPPIDLDYKPDNTVKPDFGESLMIGGITSRQEMNALAAKLKADLMKEKFRHR